MRPVSMRPSGVIASPGCLGTRIHKTSMGAPRSRLSSRALARTVEWRPSAPMTRAARMSSAPRGPRAATPTTRPLGEEIEEVPLRHQRDELATRRQMREIADDDALVADLALDLRQLVVRPLQELVEQAQLVHQLE